jgi:hypothetical protein
LFIQQITLEEYFSAHQNENTYLQEPINSIFLCDFFGFLDYSILGLLDLPSGGWIVGFLDYSILGLLDLPFGGWIVGFLDYSILGLLDLPSGGWIVGLLDFCLLFLLFTLHFLIHSRA